MATLEKVDVERAWAAVCARDRNEDGAFVFAVRTTGVYCRPSCPARQPLRKNVEYFALSKDAEAAGYRPCKRCRPNDMSTHQRDALSVEAACRRLERGPVALDALASDAGLSAHHFHRIFKAHTGLTPKAYGEAHRGQKMVKALGETQRVADAAFAAGFENLSRFYDAAARRFGVRPSTLASGGLGEIIIACSASAPLGVVTAAFSRRGVAAIVLTETAEEGREHIAQRFGEAILLDGGADFETMMACVLDAVAEPERAAELPLDIRGTAFEERVWAALRKIPVGSTLTYAQVAEAIGAPTAHRAVARACGANKIAVAIPCHRVVRADGSLAGYRWGVERKAALIKAEAERGSDAP
ncbi:MAG: bifunctional DNA-binding transcriptional regulator/O6-methylguanine-DNA methyltransferase Ada [Pseudomonadota bacterium]